MAMETTDAVCVPGPKGNLILVVENDEGLSRQERLVLEEAGYCVACAGSGEEALEMLPATSPALVLLDIVAKVVGMMRSASRPHFGQATG